MGQASAASANSAEAKSFVENAAIGDLYEIKAATIALRRSRSDGVKALARKMIDDHTTASHQLSSTLRSMPDVPEPPSDVDSRRATMIDHLEKAPEDEFDKRYLEQQELAHQETLTLFRNMVERQGDPRLRLFAAGTLSSLERHLVAVRGTRH